MRWRKRTQTWLGANRSQSISGIRARIQHGNAPQALSFGKMGCVLLWGKTQCTHICMLHACNCLSDVCVCKCVNAFAARSYLSVCWREICCKQ